MKDLVVVVADKDAALTMGGLLSSPERLDVSTFSYDVHVEFGHDSACYRNAHEFLRPFQSQYAFALVLVDREGSGRENLAAERMEAKIEDSLARSGWAARCAAIVMDPELEIWVWSRSPHVKQFLGWTESSKALDERLTALGFERGAFGKPSRPKEAVRAIWRLTNTPISSARFQRLAEVVSLKNCEDRAFKKLCTTLKSWFPPSQRTA